LTNSCTIRPPNQHQFLLLVLQPDGHPFAEANLDTSDAS
jgi:hypothetical protein